MAPDQCWYATMARLGIMAHGQGRNREISMAQVFSL